MDKKVIGHRISSLRKEKGITQKELAERLCVTDKSVSKWETGVHFPDIAIIEKLAYELGITSSELLGFEQATTTEVIEGMAVVSEEEKNKIKKRMKFHAWEQIFYGIVVTIALIYLSWRLHLIGIEGGVYGICTIGILALVDGQIANGLYTLFHIKKL